jgi:TRAP-type C4-dicarboxylate transport system permease small subunit
MQSILPRNPFTRSLQAVVDSFALICGWWLLALSGLTCVEMLGRKVFGFSLQGVDEIGSYTFAAVGAFGFSYTLVTRGHTRVDFLLSHFSEKQRAALNFTAMITLAAMAVFCAYRAFHVVAESISLGSSAASALDSAVDLVPRVRPVLHHGAGGCRIRVPPPVRRGLADIEQTLRPPDA